MCYVRQSGKPKEPRLISERLRTGSPALRLTAPWVGLRYFFLATVRLLAAGHLTTLSRLDSGLLAGVRRNVRVSRVPWHILKAVLLALQSLAVVVSGFLRLGPLQLPVFGLVGTGGLLAALWLGQRTAPRAGVDRHRLWDAGVVAILSAFLTSRLLLIAVNFRLFAAHPFLMLAQPSLTAGGLGLTAVVVWLWLRRRHLPLLPTLDAWAAPAALLAAVLQLAHFAEGSDAGMPTTLPWGVHTSGDLTFIRAHPVQLYAAAADFALCLWLLRLLGKHVSPEDVSWSWRALSWRALSPRAGSTAALGLLIGGCTSFTLSFFRQPYDALGTAWLDPGQYAALAILAAGLMLWISLLANRMQPVAPFLHAHREAS